MKLATVRITNFKSIEDSDAFTVGDLTCLAGKNESGKTALLQALYRLNPVETTEAEYVPLEEYPRQRYSSFSIGREPKGVLDTSWQLDRSEIQAIEEKLGEGCLQNGTVRISKGYQNQATWRLDLDEAAVVEHLISTTTSLTERARDRFAGIGTIKELADAIASNRRQAKGEQELRARITELAGENAHRTAIGIVKQFLPRFLYMDQFNTMKGQIRADFLSQVMTDESVGDRSDRIFGALMQFANVEVDEVTDVRRSEELTARLEAVSITLSQEIFRYWTQNTQLRVIFEFRPGRPEDEPPFNDGEIFSVRIVNQRYSVSVPFDSRSAGFVWFFSFLTWFSQMKALYGDRLVILLDEPGLSLHGRAQIDLLRYINEQLTPSYQVIYTTHSPFMIDPTNLLNVRTVEDVVGKDHRHLGTKVGDKVLSTDSDTLFPLRAALGYDISQSLFVGEHNLVVEGPSDLLYLRWASNELRKLKREYLDPRWTISPAGGVDKVSSFVALFGGGELHVAVLTDYRRGDKAKVRRLRESELLERGHVFSADTYARLDEADIEDMLGRGFYVALVNACYHLPKSKAIPQSKKGDSEVLVTDEIEAHFRTLNPGDPTYDHYAPAAYLTEHWSALSGSLPGVKDALDRMEHLFKDLNALLP